MTDQDEIVYAREALESIATSLRVIARVLLRTADPRLFDEKLTGNEYKDLEEELE